jgi:hypothetical protein
MMLKAPPRWLLLLLSSSCLLLLSIGQQCHAHIPCHIEVLLLDAGEHHLLQSNLLPAIAPHDVAANCNNNNTIFELGLFAHDHVLVVARARARHANEPDCALEFDSRNTASAAVGVFLHIKPEAVRAIADTNVIWTGAYATLGNIKRAARVASRVSHEVYDVLKHNCGVKLIQFLNDLGFGIRPSWRDFLVSSLSQAPELVHSIRKHANAAKLCPGRQVKNVIDSELVGALVDITITLHDKMLDVTLSDASDVPEDLSTFGGGKNSHEGNTLLMQHKQTKRDHSAALHSDAHHHHDHHDHHHSSNKKQQLHP